MTSQKKAVFSHAYMNRCTWSDHGAGQVDGPIIVGRRVCVREKHSASSGQGPKVAQRKSFLIGNQTIRVIGPDSTSLCSLATICMNSTRQQFLINDPELVIDICRNLHASRITIMGDFIRQSAGKVLKHDGVARNLASVWPMHHGRLQEHQLISSFGDSVPFERRPQITS